MANLKSLIRLRKHGIDEKQKILADLFRKVEQLEERKRALLEDIEREKKIMEASEFLETREYYGRYAQGVRRQIERIEKDIKKLDVRIQIAQDEIREAFADMKRIEIVQKNRESKETAERGRKESNELDDIGVEGFRRQENEKV